MRDEHGSNLVNQTSQPKGIYEVTRFSNHGFSEGAGEAPPSPSRAFGRPPAASLGAVLSPSGTPDGVIRILLSRAASDALTATGERAFAIVHRCMRGVEEPETVGRWCITLAPVEWETAQDASAVLLGTKRAAPLRKPRRMTSPGVDGSGVRSESGE
jgi:hypothetical protein